jgi:hypothetical protein
MFFFLDLSHRELWEHLLSRTRTNVSTAPHPTLRRFSPLLDAGLLQYVANPCIAYIVVLTLTAHHQFSIGVTVRLILVYTINEIV